MAVLIYLLLSEACLAHYFLPGEVFLVQGPDINVPVQDFSNLIRSSWPLDFFCPLIWFLGLAGFVGIWVWLLRHYKVWHVLMLMVWFLIELVFLVAVKVDLFLITDVLVNYLLRVLDWLNNTVSVHEIINLDVFLNICIICQYLLLLARVVGLLVNGHLFTHFHLGVGGLDTKNFMWVYGLGIWVILGFDWLVAALVVLGVIRCLIWVNVLSLIVHRLLEVYKLLIWAIKWWPSFESVLL